MVTTDDQEPTLCVEVGVADGSWVEGLPPAPSSDQVSVSFDDVELAARDRTAVTQLGYHVVGTAGVRRSVDVAHLMVRMQVVEGHPRWWRAVLGLASRVYDLRFGPVQLALSEVVRLHAAARGDGAVIMRRRRPSPESLPPTV